MAQDMRVLRSLFEDSAINEIMVNRYDQIFVEHNGKLEPTNIQFDSEQDLYRLIEELAHQRGTILSNKQPFLDTFLEDGSRVNAVIPPMSVDGPALTIRRFSENPFALSDLISLQCLSDRCAYFLQLCVHAKTNIIVSGGTSSGKTTLLNVLSALIPTDERIITIEDTPELNLVHSNWVRLESVPNFNENSITIRDCLRNALRMRPDRIIIGECRGAEAFDMLQALNTGHDGSLTTVHANSPRDCLARLESLILASQDYPLTALRKQIVSAIDIIVQVKRDRSGERRITDILELTGIEETVITTQSIFEQDDMEVAEVNGLVPQIMSAFQECGLKIPNNFFDPNTYFKPKPS